MEGVCRGNFQKKAETGVLSGDRSPREQGVHPMGNEVRCFLEIYRLGRRNQNLGSTNE